MISELTSTLSSNTWVDRKLLSTEGMEKFSYQQVDILAAPEFGYQFYTISYEDLIIRDVFRN